VIPLHLKQI